MIKETNNSDNRVPPVVLIATRTPDPISPGAKVVLAAIDSVFKQIFRNRNNVHLWMDFLNS